MPFVVLSKVGSIVLIKFQALSGEFFDMWNPNVIAYHLMNLTGIIILELNSSETAECFPFYMSCQSV